MLKPKIHDGCRSREVFSVKAQEKYFTKRGTILAQSSFALRNYLLTTAVGFRFPQLERYGGHENTASPYSFSSEQSTSKCRRAANCWAWSDGAQDCCRESDCGRRPPGPANLYLARWRSGGSPS